MHVLGVHVCVSDACTCAYRLKLEESLGALLCPPLPCSLVAGSSLVLLFPWLASAPSTPLAVSFWLPSGLNSEFKSSCFLS